MQNDRLGLVIAVRGGLVSAGIDRLKLLDEKGEVLFEKMADACDNSLSYKASRQIVTDRIYHDQAVLPFLGMYLTDATFIQEGNKDYIGGDISTTKLQLQTSLKELASFSKSPYLESLRRPMERTQPDFPLS